MGPIRHATWTAKRNSTTQYETPVLESKAVAELKVFSNERAAYREWLELLMNAFASALTEDDIKAIAKFYSSQEGLTTTLPEE